MPIIGQKLYFLFESDPAIGDVLEPPSRHCGESSESSLSCRKFTDELRRVKGRGVTSGKIPGRAQVVWSSYSLDIYQQGVVLIPLRLASKLLAAPNATLSL